MELPFEPVIPLLRIYPKKTETPIRKDMCIPMFTAKIWKQPKCSSDEWIKKLWAIYTMKYYAAVKKEGILTICSSMDGTGEHYAK